MAITATEINYTLKIISDGRFQNTNICLIRNGKQVVWLPCKYVTIEFECSLFLKATVVVVVTEKLKKYRKLLFGLAGGGSFYETFPQSEAEISLPVSEISIVGNGKNNNGRIC